jgi:hypothetical protein
MRHFRFSIAGLLGVVLYVAVVVAALRAATYAWDRAVFGLTLVALLMAVLLAVHRIGRRAFWLGFALFGWAYLGASLIPPVGSRLPTTKGLAYLDSKVPGRENYDSWVKAALAYTRAERRLVVLSDGQTATRGQDTGVRLWDAVTGNLLSGPAGTSENFLHIGHSLVALLVAFLGGHLSRYLHSGGRSRRENDPPPPIAGLAPAGE